MAKIAAIIGWVGTALVVVAFGLRFLKPELDVYRTYTAWAGLACILVYLARAVARVVDRRQRALDEDGHHVDRRASSRCWRSWPALNYLGVRQNKRWDLTANQVFSLSEQTLKVLRGLDAPAKITVYDLATGFDRIKDRLEEYTYQSKQLTVEYVDLDREPARTKAASVTAPGTLVLEYKGRVERITQIEEQDIANAFIKATTGQERKVYFTQGHGEKDPASSERTGYSAVAEALKGDNYGFEKLVLAQTSAVPDGATAVVIAGPVTDFFPGEIDAHQEVPRQGRHALRDARPGGEGRTGRAAQPHRPAQGMGHRGGRRRRRRRLGRRPDVRRGPDRAGGGELPGASHHRALQPDDGLPAGAFAHDRDGRWPHAAVDHRDERSQLGREGPRRPGRRHRRRRSTPTRATGRDRSRWRWRSRRRPPTRRRPRNRQPAPRRRPSPRRASS